MKVSFAQVNQNAVVHQVYIDIEEHQKTVNYKHGEDRH